MNTPMVAEQIRSHAHSDDCKKAHAHSQMRRALNLSFADGFFSAITAGTAETFAMFFAIKKGLSLSQVGVVSTLPILLGAACQWLIPRFIKNAQLKTSLIAAQIFQILGLVGLLIAFSAPSLYHALLWSLSLYWIGGMLAGPVWLDWVSPWLPEKLFAKYLSRRNGFMSLSTLCAYVLSALAVHLVHNFSAFRWVFSVALISRIFAMASIVLQPSPKGNIAPSEQETPAPSIWKSKPILFIVLFTTLFKFAVNVSSPFFAPYMLNELKFSLIQYVALTSIPFIGRVVMMPRWNKALSKIRPFIGLQITMTMISLSPTLWTLSTSKYFLGCAEIVSGAMWAGFELCSLLIIKNFWPGNARPLLGMHLALQALASLAGAATGSWLMTKNLSFHEVFLLSSDFRILTTLGFCVAIFHLKETRSRLHVYGEFLSTLLTIRPSLANVGRLIPAQAARWKQSSAVKS